MGNTGKLSQKKKLLPPHALKKPYDCFALFIKRRLSQTGGKPPERVQKMQCRIELYQWRTCNDVH